MKRSDSPRNVRRNQQVSLGLLIAATLLPIGLSLFAQPIRYVTAVAFASGIVTLLAGLAWLFPDKVQQNALRLRQKRQVLALCLTLIASVPITHWPLRIGFALSRQALTNAALEADWHAKVQRKNDSLGASIDPRWFQSVRKRAGLFFVTRYATEFDQTLSLYIAKRRYSHSAFQYRADNRWSPNANAVDLGGGWKFVERMP